MLYQPVGFTCSLRQTWGGLLCIPKLRQSSHFPPFLTACSKPWTSAPLA